MEETLTNWEQFTTFYIMIRDGAWPIFLAGHALILIFGIVRFIWAYATASQIGKVQHSTFAARIFEYIFYLTFYNDKERIEYEQGYRDCAAKDKHLGGTGIDLLIWTILGLIFIYTWPVLVPVLMLFVPLQISHLHFKRKKTFIANLKGEHLDI